MANLKIDLLNKLRNDKFYEETELVRLAENPNMNYKEKIDEIVRVIESIGKINGTIMLIEQYFKEQQPQEQAPNNVGAPNTGQSHAE